VKEKRKEKKKKGKEKEKEKRKKKKRKEKKMIISGDRTIRPPPPYPIRPPCGSLWSLQSPCGLSADRLVRKRQNSGFT